MQHTYLAGLLAFGASGLLGPVAQAQTTVLQQDTARNGATTFLRLATSGPGRWAAADAGLALRTLLKLRLQDELRPQRAQADALGLTQTWYSQYYKGVPVEYGVYVVHTRNGAIETLNGEVTKIGALNTAPGLTGPEALANALLAVGGSSGQAAPAEQLAASDGPTTTLLVSRDETVAAGARLAYKFVVATPPPTGSYYVYVDARSGEVFRKLPTRQVGHTATGGARVFGLGAPHQYPKGVPAFPGCRQAERIDIFPGDMDGLYQADQANIPAELS